jgi:hypothetical protein
MSFLLLVLLSPQLSTIIMFISDVQNTKSRDALNILVASGDFASQLSSKFALSTFVVSTDSLLGTGITALNREIIYLGNNWYRVLVNFRKASGITSLFLSHQVNNGTTNSFVGDVAKGIILRPRLRLVQSDPLTISGTPGTASNGVAYTFTPTVTNGTSAFAYSLFGGALPTGLSFSTSTGVISGTPTVNGTTGGLIIAVTDANGLSATTPSLSITVANAVAPSNSVAPALTNPSVQSAYVAQGQILSSSTGTWSGAPTPTYAYQWKRAGSAISGATSSTYTVQAADDAALITCTVTATNTQGSASATSSSVTAIAGTLRVNEPFNSQGSWSSSGGFSYAGGKLVVSNATNFNGVSLNVASMTAGKTLRMIFDQTVVDSGDAFVVAILGTTSPTGTQRTTTGTYTDNITIPASPTGVAVQTRAANCDGTFDNIFAVELP